MAQTIKLKRSATAGAIPSTSDLALGEIAINTADGAVYIKKGNDDIVAVADNDILHIDTTNGRVGIGTTSPSYYLDINPGSNTQAHARLKGGHATMILDRGSTSYDSNLSFLTGGVTKWRLWNDGSDNTLQIRDEANAANVMTWETGGDVGIGTSSPNRKLHVSGSGATIAVKAEATDGNQSSLDLKNSEGEFRLINDGGSLFVYDQTDTAERLRIDTSGNVGIGTTSPGRQLHVQMPNLSAGTGNGIRITDDSALMEIGLRKDGSGNRRLAIFEDGGTYPLVLQEDGGNVGIGVTNPLAKLHVDGNVYVDTGHTLFSDIIRPYATTRIIFGQGTNDIAHFTGSVGIRTSSPDTNLDVTAAGVQGLLMNQDTSSASVSSRLFFKDSTRTNAIVNVNGNLEIRTGATIGSSSGTKRLVVKGDGTITFNDAYTFPASDGSANQVLQTDGSGNLSFATVSGGGGVTISNNANNRVLTGDGTNANAEANLTFDGSTLTVTGNQSVTGGITVGDSSADVLRFVGLLKHGSGSGTTIVNSNRQLESLSLYTYGSLNLPTVNSSVNGTYQASSNTSSIINHPISGEVWHDIFAHRRAGTWTYETSTDGSSFSSATISENPFDHKDTTGVNILTSTVKAARWTVSGLQYATIKYFSIAAQYVNSGINVKFKVETSSDGSSWTTRVAETTFNPNTFHQFFRTSGDHGGQGYIRVTLTKDNLSSTTNVDICRLCAWSNRPGDQGLGKENQLPFDYTLRDAIDFRDNQKLRLGASQDLELYHNGTDSKLENYTGNLYITNEAQDKDVILSTDNGSGSVTPYITLDGSTTETTLHRTTKVDDNFYLGVGAGPDLYLMHDGSNSHIRNNTGNITIQNNTDDGDIIFRSDDGSGGTTTYMTIDGGEERVVFSKWTRHVDNARILVGTGGDLAIYHDGSNSYIRDSGTGNLRIDATDFYVRNSAGTELKIGAVDDGAVTLYYDGSAKLATKSDGVDITGELQSDSLDVDGNGDISGNLTIGGNLTINGSTVTNSATNTTIEDALIELGSGNTGTNSNDLGLILERGTTGDNIFMGWDESIDRVRFATTTATGASTGALTLSNANVEAGRFYGDVTGNVTGNADTATSATSATTAGTVTTAAQPNITSLGTLTTLTVDDITINGSTISDSGDLTFDVGGDIILDGDGQDIILKDGGTEFGRFTQLIGGLAIGAGSPGGSYPMLLSSTKVLIFTDMQLGDDEKIIIGDGATGNLQIFHDGTDSFLDDVAEGNLILRTNGTSVKMMTGSENMLVATKDGSVDLYYDNSKKFETTSGGVSVTGNIAVSGTVDGRDVATDGTKLDGIESGATADQTQSEINALGITATGLSGTPNITVGTIDATEFTGHIEAGGHLDFNIGVNHGTTGNADRWWISQHSTGQSDVPGSYYDIINLSSSATHGVQIASNYGATSGQIYMRTRSDNNNAPSGTGLQGWKRLYHQDFHPEADTLTTARTIGGVSFDGSANINLPGVNTAGNQNTSGTAAGLSGTPNITVGTVSGTTANFTTSLDASLTVQSTDSTTGIVFTDPNGTGHIYYIGSQDRFYTDGKFGVNGSTIASGMEFQVNGDSKLTGTLDVGDQVTVQSSTSTPLSSLFAGSLVVKGSGSEDPIIAVTDSGTANAAAGVFHQSSTNPGFPALVINAASNGSEQPLISARTNVSNTTGVGGTEVFAVDGDGDATFAGSITVSGTVDGVDIAARNAVLTSTTTTANAALPKAGGTMTGNLTIGSTTDSTKIVFPDKNVPDDPTAASHDRQLIGMGNSGAGGLFQTTGRGGLMLASADDSLIIASGDVGRNYDPDAGGYHPDPNNEEIYLLTDGGVRFMTNLQTSASYKQFIFDNSGNATIPGNITVSGTVDGRDIATDGTKLDGIEANATADQTQSEINALGITATGLSGTPNISVGTIASDTIEINTAINDNSHGLLISNGSLSGAGNLRIAIPKASGNYSTASQLGGITIRNETAGGNIVVGAKDHVIIGVGGSDYDERLKATTAGVDITGALTATTKSFDIEHPSKDGMRLRYGSLEGPENGVYVRGKSQEKVISLPEYWPDLIHEDSITVQLTAIGSGQELYVEKIEDNKVYVNGENYFYYIQAERKDVERFEVEYSE